MINWKQLCQEMLTFLEWYIEEDDTYEGDTTSDGGVNWNEQNAYWLEGRNRAIEFVEYVKPLLAEQVCESCTPETGIDQYTAEYTRALADAKLIEPLPSDLDGNQWQSLLVGSLQMLANTHNPAPDLAYARWLLDQWYASHSKSND